MWNTIYIVLLLEVFILGKTDSVTLMKCTNEELRMRCDENCAIEIQKAVYGHSGTACVLRGDHCTSNASQVYDGCSGERECKVYVDQQRPTGRCSQSSAYIMVNYQCKCEEKECPLLDDPAHGRVVFSSARLVLRTRAAYTCEAGYTLVGPQLRECGTGGQWDLFQPTCVAADTKCPKSPYPVKVFDDKCYEFVPTVETFAMASDSCRDANGTLLVLHDFREVQFVAWQLGKMAAHGYFWAAFSTQFMNTGSHPVPGDYSPVDITECYEFYKGGGDKWVTRTSPSCLYLNQYICTHDPVGTDGLVHHALPPDSKPADKSPNKETMLGLVVGLVVAIVLVVVVLVFFCCRRRWKLKQKEKQARSMGGQVNKMAAERGHEMYEQELYDDAASVMASTDEVTINIPVPVSYNYSQVKKESKKGRKLEPKNSFYEDTVPNQTYDDVYENSHPSTHAHNHPSTHAQRHAPRYKTASQNAYENIKVMNLVGSLKKKLRTGKLRHIDIGEGSSSGGSGCHGDEHSKFHNGRENRGLDHGKPVPAARNSMKKDSRNRVNVGKPARNGSSRNDVTAGTSAAGAGAAGAGLRSRVSSEPEFVENELYEDRVPYDGFVYSQVQ